MQASLPLWAIFSVIVGRSIRFVFTASWAAHNGRVIARDIISEEVERSAGFLRALIVDNQFPIIVVDVGFERTSRCQFMYPSFRASKLPGRSPGIENPHGEHEKPSGNDPFFHAMVSLLLPGVKVVAFVSVESDHFRAS